MIDKLLQVLNSTYSYLRRDERLLTHLTIFLVVGFGLLTLLVVVLPPEILDLEASLEVQEDQTRLLDALMHFVSWFGNGIAPGAIPISVALVFLSLKARREALFTVLTLLSGVVIYGIKLLINRPRPTADLIRIIEHAQFQSFPSGHVTFYVTFFGFMAFLMYRLKWLAPWLRIAAGVFCLLLIFSIPFSRMYLGAHWFTDVLGGFIIGLLCLIVLARWYSQGAGRRRDQESEATE